VVCGLIAMAGSSPWITESWCVDAGAGGFPYGSVRVLSCLMMSHIHFVRAYRRIESLHVKVGASELVLSVVKLRVRCGMPVATRVEVSLLLCFV